MKRILFAIALFVGGLNSLWAGQIPMQIIDHGPAAGGSTLAPPRPWYITQNDYVLIL